MSTGTGKLCRCCEKQLDYEVGFDEEMQLCDECKNKTIPMVRMYLSRFYGI